MTTEQLVKNLKTMEANLGDDTKSMNNLQQSLSQTTTTAKATNVGLGVTQKTIRATGVAAKAAATMIKTALYSIGIGLIIEGIVQIYNLVNRIVQKSREVKRTNDEIAKSTNQMASKGIVVLKELANAYAKVADTAEAKQEFLTKYADKIKETGLAIDTVKEAEDVFVKNTQKYVDAMIARAKAQATEAAAIKLYQEYLDKRYQLEQKLDKSRSRNGLFSGIRQKGLLKKIEEEDKRIDERMHSLLEDVAELEEEAGEVIGSLEATITPETKTNTDTTD